MKIPNNVTMEILSAALTVWLIHFITVELTLVAYGVHVVLVCINLIISLDNVSSVVQV